MTAAQQAAARLSLPAMRILPVAPAGSVDAQTMQAITDPNSLQTQTTGDTLAPRSTIYPVGPSPVNVQSPVTDPPGGTVQVSAGGIMNWAQANPMAAAGLVAVGIYLLYKAVKK